MYIFRNNRIESFIKPHLDKFEIHSVERTAVTEIINKQVYAVLLLQGLGLGVSVSRP